MCLMATAPPLLPSIAEDDEPAEATARAGAGVILLLLLAAAVDSADASVADAGTVPRATLATSAVVSVPLAASRTDALIRRIVLPLAPYKNDGCGDSATAIACSALHAGGSATAR